MLISVSETNNLLKRKIDHEVLRNRKIHGEITSLNKTRKGHVYLTLTDPNKRTDHRSGYLSCTIWSRCFDKPLKEGQSIIVDESNLSPWDGRYSICINKYRVLENQTEESSVDIYQALKNDLEARGIFKAKQSFSLNNIKKIAIITSPTGAVLQDFLTTIERRGHTFDLDLYEASMQGSECISSIIKALEECEDKNYDVIVIARGGGSKEDLAPFNDADLAEYISKYPLNIISAIGHETDFSFIEYASNIRAATPTAAAELVTSENYRGTLAKLENYRTEIKGIVRYNKELLDSFDTSIKNVINDNINKLNNLGHYLKLIDVEQILNNNFAILTDIQGNIIDNSMSLQELEEFVIVRKDEKINISI